MSKPGKDSREVVEFKTLFARLKLFSYDAPEDLGELAASDFKREGPLHAAFDRGTCPRPALGKGSYGSILNRNVAPELVTY